MNTLEKFKEFYNKTTTEAKWWAYAAWTFPLAALSGVFFVTIIGWTDYLHKIAIIGGVIFFSISAFWWWWALYKLVGISKLMLNTAENLKEIGSELKDINREIHLSDK